jgi:uncharacterized protein (TIRG00374 family)
MWVRLLNLGFFVVGVTALGFMIREVGTDEIHTALTSLGHWVWALAALALAQVVIDARAMHVFMRPEQRMIRFPRVLAAQLAGQAVNTVTPSGALGEVVKMTMMVGHAPRYRAISALVLKNLVAGLASVGSLLLAIAVSLLAFDVHPDVELMLAISFVAILAVTTGLLLLVRRGLVKSLAGAARSFHLISAERRAWICDRLTDLDEQLRPVARLRTPLYRPAIAYVLVSRILGFVDLYLILIALGSHPSLPFVLVVSGSSMILGSIAAVVPMGIGIYDGGLAGLFSLLGASAGEGLIVSLVRRLRGVAIAILGLATMLAVQVIDAFLLRRALAARRAAGGHMAPPDSDTM